MFICRQKNQLHPPCFPGDIAKICKILILGTLGKHGCTHPKWYINLWRLPMFISMTTINFIIHFFLEILHFKESCNLIGWQHFGPQLENQNFARYEIGGEISTTLLVSTLNYFYEKLNEKQTDGQTDEGDFIGPSVGRGSNKAYSNSKWSEDIIFEDNGEIL